MLKSPPDTVAIIARAGAPSLRKNAAKTCPKVNRGTTNLSHLRYLCARGRIASFAPANLSRAASPNAIAAHAIAATTATPIIVIVKISSADRLSPSPRNLAKMTEPPTPNSSPKLMMIVHTGVMTASAAMPSAPSYCPTMIQSTME